MDVSRLRASLSGPISQGLAGAALGAIPFWRAPRLGRIAFITLPALGAAAMVATMTRSQFADQDPTPSEAVLPIAAASLTAASQWFGLRVDRRVELFLIRHRVPVPRLVIGAVSGLLLVLVSAAEPPVRPVPDHPALEVSDHPG